MVFADTDVMVDILREYPPAVAWLTGLGTEPIVLSGFVCAELVAGAETKKDADKIGRFLTHHSVIWPSAETCSRAFVVFAANHLGHKLGIIDAIIGQMAVELKMPLCTFNRKHYSCVPGIDLVQPYDKS